VGKNGTFWLPPESTNFFSSKLKDLSSKKSRFVSKNQNNNPSSTNANAKQAGERNSQSKSIIPQNLSRSSKVNNSHILQSTKSNLTPKNTKNTGVRIQTNYSINPVYSDSSLSSKNPVMRGFEKKSSESENLLSKEKENQLLVGDKEEHGGQKSPQDHGAKDATIDNLMFMTERLNLIFTQAATIAKSENRLEEKSIRLLEELAKEIATKIALLEKSESKIVRMAFDLPNGSALSVRIEQTPSNL